VANADSNTREVGLALDDLQDVEPDLEPTSCVRCDDHHGVADGLGNPGVGREDRRRQVEEALCDDASPDAGTTSKLNIIPL
jgi:hypothetical protein